MSKEREPLRLTHEAGQLGVREALALDLVHVVEGEVAQLAGLEPLLDLVQPPELGQEPGVNVGELKDLLIAVAVLHCLQTTAAALRPSAAGLRRMRKKHMSRILH